MSYESRKNDVVIVGDWAGAVVAEGFLSAGHRVELLHLPSRGADTDTALYVGNGECRENARLILGDALMGEIWEVSTANLARAKSLGVGKEGPVVWHASSDREKELLSRSGSDFKEGKLVEPGRLVGISELEKLFCEKLVAAGVRITETKSVLKIERCGQLDYNVHADGVRVTAPVVVVASEELVPALFPTIRDKWLPATLTSAVYPSHTSHPFSLALFHLGADFAVNGPRGLRLGSYRNLFEDKAFGVHDKADPATLKGVAKFFGDLGWIDPVFSPAVQLMVEAISCDGPGLVGTLPDLPGVYVVGAFGGKTMNFIFEVAHRLSVGIVKGQGFSGLNCFSTKRFV